jgi:hypothetical protein
MDLQSRPQSTGIDGSVSRNARYLRRESDGVPSAAATPMNKTLLPRSQLETPKFAKLCLLARVSPACRVVRIMNGPFLGNEHPMWIWSTGCDSDLR